MCGGDTTNRTVFAFDDYTSGIGGQLWQELLDQRFFRHAGQAFEVTPGRVNNVAGT